MNAIGSFSFSPWKNCLPAGTCLPTALLAPRAGLRSGAPAAGVTIYRRRRSRNGRLQWELVRQEAQSLLKHPERLGQPVDLPEDVAAAWGTRWILEAISDLHSKVAKSRRRAKEFLFLPDGHFDAACIFIEVDPEIIRGFARKYLQAEGEERKEIKRRISRALHAEHRGR